MTMRLTTWWRRLLPGWIWLEPTVAEARIALNKLQPVEPPELARKRAHRVTAPVQRGHVNGRQHSR